MNATAAAACESCGGELKCPGCDDTRPTAEDLYQGWLLRSPLDRLETVTRVEQEGSYGPVRVWTDKTGPNYSWRYHRTERVDAVRPPQLFHGDPEIRVVEYDYARDAPMYAVPTLSTIYRADSSRGYLVEARYQKGKGWYVSHRPGGGDVATTWHDSKAKARTALKAAAKIHAKALGVKVTTEATR